MIARALALASALALAGCSALPGAPVEETAVEAPESASPVAGAAGSTLRVEGAVDVGGALRVVATRITVSARDAPATGAVEMARPAPTAATALARDSWKLLVDLEERSPGALAAGARLVARLEWAEADRGAIRVTQAETSGAAEGVRLAFDVGRELETEASYVLVVEREIVPPLVVALATAANLTWASANGTNAPLALAAGAPVEFQVANGDGGFHNLVVRDAGGARVAGPSANVATEGASTVLAWTPARGEFAYVCEYHAQTMRGAIRVT